MNSGTLMSGRRIWSEISANKMCPLFQKERRNKRRKETETIPYQVFKRSVIQKCIMLSWLSFRQKAKQKTREAQRLTQK